MNPALMIIDMQKAYYEGAAKDSMTFAAEYINEVLGYFRDKNLPVIWIQDIDKESGVIPETDGFQIIELLKPNEGEAIIYKEYGNSFNHTRCGEILKKENVDIVFLTGYCAEYCVLSTYIGARDLDFTPAIVKNGIASGNKENLMFVERIYDTVSYNIIRKMIETIS